MKVAISKSEVRGKVIVPSSKSYTIRGLVCAALSQGDSQIINPLSSDDTNAAMDALSKIGVGIQHEENLCRVNGGHFHEPDSDVFCKDSAATLRFMTALCSLVPGRVRLTAGVSLSKRPVKPLVQALSRLGVCCSSQGEVTPVIVIGGGLEGGFTELPGNVSSQFISSLLLISPLAENGVTFKLTTPLVSKPYVYMTLDCMEKFGVKVSWTDDRFEIARQTYQPTTYEVEGDWSSASYFLAMGAVSGGVEIENLNPDSLQGDKVMLDFLSEMGAPVAVNGNKVTVGKAKKLNAIRADLADCTDLLPTMAVLAAVADGVSEFSGINGARIKESNRVTAVREGLEAMGIKVVEERDKLWVTGSKLHGAVIDTQGDHRIAMAFSVLGVIAGKTVINEAECVTKTFPQFWDILKSMGGRLKINGQ